MRAARAVRRRHRSNPTRAESRGRSATPIPRAPCRRRAGTVLGDPLRVALRHAPCDACAAALRSQSVFRCSAKPRPPPTSAAGGGGGGGGGACEAEEEDEITLLAELADAPRSAAQAAALRAALRRLTEAARAAAAALAGGQPPGAPPPRRFCRLASLAPPMTLQAAELGLRQTPLTLAVLPAAPETPGEHGTPAGLREGRPRRRPLLVCDDARGLARLLRPRLPCRRL